MSEIISKWGVYKGFKTRIIAKMDERYIIKNPLYHDDVHLSHILEGEVCSEGYFISVPSSMIDIL